MPNALSAGAVRDLAVLQIALNLIKLDEEINEIKTFDFLPREVSEDFLRSVNKLQTTLEMALVNFGEYGPKISLKLAKIKGWDDCDDTVNLIQIAALLLMENFSAHNRAMPLAPSLATIWEGVNKAVYFIADVLEDYGEGEISAASSRLAFRILERLG